MLGYAGYLAGTAAAGYGGAALQRPEPNSPTALLQRVQDVEGLVHGDRNERIEALEKWRAAHDVAGQHRSEQIIDVKAELMRLEGEITYLRTRVDTMHPMR